MYNPCMLDGFFKGKKKKELEVSLDYLIKLVTFGQNMKQVSCHPFSIASVICLTIKRQYFKYVKLSCTDHLVACSTC